MQVSSDHPEEERSAIYPVRTAAHDALIDARNILSRNMRKAGEDNEWYALMQHDRKERRLRLSSALHSGDTCAVRKEGEIFEWGVAIDGVAENTNLQAIPQRVRWTFLTPAAFFSTRSLPAVISWLTFRQSDCDTLGWQVELTRLETIPSNLFGQGCQTALYPHKLV